MDVYPVGGYSLLFTDRDGGAIGEVRGRDIVKLTWERLRDDISKMTVTIKNTPDTRQVLHDVKTVRFDVKVMRGGLCVWDGVVTYKGEDDNAFEVFADDMLWFATRRIMTIGHDLSSVGVDRSRTVIDLCAEILDEVFGPANIFGVSVSPIASFDEARTVAVIPPYSRNVWEPLDEFAAQSGIDYTMVRRTLFLWDTHCRIAQTLPLGQKDLKERMRLVEYGSDLRTRSWFVGNNGTATYSQAPQQWLDYYRVPIDVITSVTDEAGGDPNPDDMEVIVTRSDRDLSVGYPAPERIVIPENTGLSPNAPVTLEQLIPGTHIPLSVTIGGRRIDQFHKLDVVRVTTDETGETVAVSMSMRPAEVAERVL